MAFVETKDRLVCHKIEVSGPIGVDIFYGEKGKERRDLNKKLKNIFDKVPDVKMDFDEAFEKELINDEDLINIYDGLEKFIEDDIKNNSRIILYLPSQLLPDMEKEIGNEKLRSSRKNFSEIYKKSWIRLLFEEDLLTDFTDGDILEPGFGEPISIRKAAHLLPNILEKKIISDNEIKTLIEVCDDEKLKINLIEGMIVAADKKLIKFDFNEDLVEKLLELKEPKLDKNFIVRRERIIWENQIKSEQELKEKSEKISQKIISGETIFEKLSNVEEITGVFRAGEKINLTEKYLPLIYDCWIKDKYLFGNSIKSGLSHWKNLNIISGEVLKKFEIKLPNFDEPLPMKLEEMVEKDFGIFKEAAKKIKEDSELMNYIYPTFLVYGSRVKGYARIDSDYDAAIFIRPGVSFEKRLEITEKIYQKIPELNKIGKIMEYWVDKKNDEFGLRLPQEKSWGILSSKEIYVFFSGAWISANDEFKKIKQDISKKYLNLERFGEQKETVRTVFLRKLETDIIQNRFMHKGFRYFYSSEKEQGTTHSDLIDWKSDFWEPKFRRVATQFFLSRVFLPEIG